MEEYQVDDGMSQSCAQQIIQDRMGFIWVGTWDGLNRYDGKNFKIYRSEQNDPSSLFASFIYRLKLDASGTLWVGLKGAISRYTPETDNFVNYLLPRKNDLPLTVQDFIFHSDKKIILATDQGVLEFNPVTGSFSPSSEFDALKKSSVSFITYYRGEFWCIAAGKLLRKKGSAFEGFENKGLRNAVVYTALADSLGLYAGTNMGLFIHQQQDQTFHLINDSKESPGSNVNAILRARNGTIWVGEDNVLVYSKDHKLINKISGNILDDPHLSSANVLTLFQSNDDVIWIGEGLGLFKAIEGVAFETLRYSPSAKSLLNDASVFSLYTEDDSILYAGTFKGLAVINLKSKKTSSRYFEIGKKSLVPQYIRAFLRDSNGNLWMGYNGLLLHNEEERKARLYLEGEEGNENFIIKIYQLNPTTLILGVRSQGIWYFDIPSKTVTKKVNVRLSTLLLEGDELLAGTFDDGLRIYTKEGELLQSIRHVDKEESSVRNGRISVIFKDSKGLYWVGMYGEGMSQWIRNENRFIHYGVNQGLPNPVVYAIKEDRNSNLWVSTNRGLSTFIRDKKGFENFQVEDGLQSSEFNLQCAFTSKNGIMYFGGVNGLTYFHPEKVLFNNTNLTSYITQFYINNELIAPSPDGPLTANILLTKSIQLNYQQNNLGFQINTLDYIHSHRLRYQYKLENYNTTWFDLGARNFITLTNLEPGKYTLKVRTSVGLSSWTQSDLSLRVNIQAPFWMTNWFRWLAITLVFVFGFVYYLLRVRRLELSKKRLELLVQSRTKDMQKQNEEIASQNEELQSQSYMLEELTRTLENKVEERTERLRILNKELLEQNTQLEQFSFITAHNLRGPVARLKGLLSLFWHGQAKTKENQEIINHFQESVDNIDMVIHDLTRILDIRGGIQKTYESINLYEEFLLAMRLLEGPVREKGIFIDYQQFDTKATIFGAKAYVESIFHNLLSNAIKYSKNNEKPFAQVKCHCETDRVIITFADNGIGIDMRYAADKLFKLYQRFNTSIPGKGFGLFLVKTQVEAMGGKISVHSVLDEGTTFTIEFPIR